MFVGKSSNYMVHFPEQTLSLQRKADPTTDHPPTAQSPWVELEPPSDTEWTRGSPDCEWSCGETQIREVPLEIYVDIYQENRALTELNCK